MKKPGPKNAPNRKNPFFYFFIILLIITIFTLARGGQSSLFPGNKAQELTLKEFLKDYEKDNFTRIEYEENTIRAWDAKDNRYVTNKEPSMDLKDLGLLDPNKKADEKVIDTSGKKMWFEILTIAFPFLLIILLFIFLAKKSSAMGENGPFGFGKSRAKIYDKTKHQTKFTDVAGAEEAKDEVVEVVDFLKHPKKYQKAGAKIPKGILLVGPPGTGKTLLARAIAGEANVPFFSVSGSEFVEMFVGVGASRVRDLFKTAKRNAPAIIFMDEIDAIGKQRGAGGAGGHDEREQTLNQILTEMDGFEEGTSVIVIAATNRPDVLDKALLRPGRFDRRVVIDLPDMEARKKILQVHVENKKLAKDADLKKIASKTVGFSGADLENVLNEAAISAVKNRKEIIEHKDLDDAVEKVAMGPARRSRRITPKEREIIAYHEVGHAIAGHKTKNCEPVEKISIVSRGSALGVTWFLPKEDTFLNSEEKMKDEMISLHGGRIAERIIFGQTTTGASNDLERISTIARRMVMTYGMGSEKLGPVVFAEKKQNYVGWDQSENEYSPETARIIDLEVQRLVTDAEGECEKILRKHLAMLKKIAKDLLEKETVLRKDFLAYFGEKDEESPRPEVKPIGHVRKKA